MRKSEEIKKDLMEFMDIAKAASEHYLKDKSNHALNFIKEKNEHQVHILSQELQDSLRLENRHRLQVILSNYKKYQSIPIQVFSGVLGSLNEIIFEIAKILKVKNSEELSLVYETDFPSSFGILIASKNSLYELIGSFNSVFNYYFNVMEELGSDHEVSNSYKNVFSKNRSLLQKYRTLIRLGVEYGLEFKTVWGDLYENQYKTAFISKNRFVELKDYIKKFDREESPINIIGKIVGISLIKNRIEIQTKDSSVLSAYAESEQLIKLKTLLEHELNFVLLETKRYHENSDQQFTNYKIIGFKE